MGAMWLQWELCIAASVIAGHINVASELCDFYVAWFVERSWH